MQATYSIEETADNPGYILKHMFFLVLFCVVFTSLSSSWIGFLGGLTCFHVFLFC